VEKGIYYQSFWTLTANDDILESDVITNIARNKCKTPSQVFFHFVMALGIIPLTGTTSEKHMKEDLAVFDFNLTNDEINQIRALLH